MPLFFMAGFSLISMFAYADTLVYETGIELATAVSNRPDGDNAFSIGVMALVEKELKRATEIERVVSVTEIEQFRAMIRDTLKFRPQHLT